LGRQVCQLVGQHLAPVEGLSDEHTLVRHILIARDDTLLIYDFAQERQHAQGGAAAVPVAPVLPRGCTRGSTGCGSNVERWRGGGALVSVGPWGGVYRGTTATGTPLLEGRSVGDFLILYQRVA